MPFKDTKDGQTNYCEVNEYKAGALTPLGNKIMDEIKNKLKVILACYYFALINNNEEKKQITENTIKNIKELFKK